MKMSLNLERYKDDAPTDVEAISLAERTELFKHYAGEKYAPLSKYVNLYNVHQAKPILDLFEGSQEKTRGLVDKIVQYLLEPGNYMTSKKEMCRVLGISYHLLLTQQMKFPIWKFVNFVICHSAIDETRGRVYQATADKAITGEHQDRRLYFELSRDIQRGGAQGSKSHGISITFINDAIKREEPRTITLEPEAEC